MKIIVTGSAGFIGHNLCKRLLNEGHIVIGVDNYTSYIYNSKFKEHNSLQIKEYSNYTEINDDLLNVINELSFETTDVVIHLAAHANVRNSIKNPSLYISNNVESTCKLVSAISKLKKKPLLIYASSSSVYGTNKSIPFKESDELNNIISPYALTKKMCEDIVEFYCRTSNVSAIGFRFFTVYGPGGRPDMAIYNFIKNINDGLPITVYGNGLMKRDYTYVDDIINGIYNSMFLNIMPGEHKIYNLGNNNPITVNELINVCEKVVNKKAIVINTEIPQGDVPITYADIDNAKRDLNYNPSVKIYEGIQNTYKWFNNLKNTL